MTLSHRSGGAARIPVLLAGVLLVGGTFDLTATQPATGTLEGTVVAEESGAPVAGARVRLAPATGADGYRSVRADEAGLFRIDAVPVGQYSVSATGNARQLRNVRTRIMEARPTRLSLQLAPQEPGLELIVHQQVFAPDERVEVVCRGFVLSPTLRLQCYRVDPLALQRGAGGSLRQFLGLGWGGDLEAADLTARPQLTTLSPAEVPITTRDAEGVFYQRVHPALPGPGLYMVAVEADGIRRVTWVAVTELGLITKHAGNRLLVYATHLKTGRPLPQCHISLLSGDQTLLETTTSAGGIADIALPARPGGDELLVAGRYGSSFAAVRAYLYSEDSEPHVVYTYTDRPVYRPGDVVSFKGIVRRASGEGYQVPAGQEVKVEVHSDAGDRIHSSALRTNSFGSFHGRLSLPGTAGSGHYALMATLEGRPYSSGFRVASYRKPEYKVTVSTDKPWYVKGDTIVATVEAEYYFGAPVAKAGVSTSVRVATMWYDPSEEELSEEFGLEDEARYAGHGEWLDSGEVVTDGSGRARVRIPTRMPRDDRDETAQEGFGADADEYDRFFTIEAVVTDPARREVTGRSTVRVARGEFSLTAEARKTVLSEGEATTVTLKAVDFEGRPVAGAEVEVAAGPVRWSQDGFEHEVGLRQTLKTDGEGRASLEARPTDRGEYRITATARDRRGNRIVRSLHLWVVAEGAGDYDYKYPELELIADKRVYDEGDTATILVNTDRVGADALVSVEGKDVFDTYTRRLDRRSTTLKVPLEGRYVPGVYVTVSYVRDKEFVTRSKRLAISTRRRELTVEVTPDRQTAAPGERIRYDLRTLKANGDPTAAEVSLAVVNEAIFAIAPEPRPDIVSAFYPRVGNRVQTDFSFPQVYLSPEDKGGRPTEVREKFRDTAHWAPAVVTDAQGRGSVEFALPDDLASWRATARAHSMATAVGTGTSTVVSRKPLMVRPILPRFVTQGDRCRIGAIVHNQSDTPQRLRLHLEPAGGRRESSRPISLAPGARYTLEREIRVASANPLPILGWARTDSGLEDAVRVTLPVLPHGRQRMDCRSGVVRDKMATTFQVHRDAIPGHGALSLRLSPSVASAMLGALSYLAGYPYGCTEQTLSAFLPDVVISRALKELKLTDSGVSSKLPEMVRDGLTRIYAYQRGDGGWGWWEQDAADPWMSAYAVYALVEAQRAGFEVGAERLSRGLEYLAGVADRKGLDEKTRGYVLYVLALGGRAEAANRGLGGDDLPPQVRSEHALATHALAAHTIGRHELAEDYLGRLWGRARSAGGGVFWGDDAGHYWDRWTQAETTAMALLATCLIRPGEPRLPRVARRLMLQRRGDHWSSTRDTAMVLYAMVEYLKLSRELEPDYTARIVLNGRVRASVRMTPQMVGRPEQVIEIPVADLTTGENTLQVELDKEGILHYTAELAQYIAQEDIPAVASRARLDIDRQYYLLRPQPGVEEPQMPSRPVDRVRYGDTLRCVVTLTAAADHSYMILEDYLPAGCEAIEPDAEDLWWRYDELGVDNIEYRDDKVAVFWRSLPAGVHRITYDLRATIPGEYRVMPSSVYSMYVPEVWGSGAESRLRVR